MSWRPRDKTESLPLNVPSNGAKRLEMVISMGHANQQSSIPVSMEGDMHGNRRYYTRSNHYHHLHAANRKVLVIKGLVFGIPDEKYREAFHKATELIQMHNITTICWDGDKFTYPSEDGSPAAASFTRLIDALQKAMPNLEFIFFKKQGKAVGLIHGMGEVEADKFGNVLGPFPFMTSLNTNVVQSTSPAPHKIMGKNYGVEFAGEMKWYELGLKGLQWIKSTLNVNDVVYMVFGLGGAVEKELNEVMKAKIAHDMSYPSGVSKEDAKIIEVIR